MREKIALVFVILLLASFFMPNVAAQSNFVESHRSGIPETLEIGKEVSIRITLDEVSSDLSSETNLTFKTGLEDPVWGFRMKGLNEEASEGGGDNRMGLLFDHAKYDNLTISLSGLASSQEKKVSILLISIKQTDESGENHVEVIKSVWGDVTTQDIEGALSSIDQAKKAAYDLEKSIENAEANGTMPTSEIRNLQNLANFHIREADRLYSESKMEESLASANNAISNATKASGLVSSKILEEKEQQEFTNQVKYGVVVAILVVVIIVVIVLIKRSSWDRLG